jgi:large repetitive protein
MIHSRHSINIVERTAALRGAVRLALLLLMCVAGTKTTFAAIENSATANGFYAGNPVQSNTVLETVLVTPGNANLVVTKVATPDTNVPAGTVVTYTYTVRNAGNQTVSNISLNDVHGGSGPAPIPANEFISTDAGIVNDSSDALANDGVWSSLAPGDVITLTATYTITQIDVDQSQ